MNVNEYNQVAYLSESPYHGDFQIGTIYSFDGIPAKHVITQEGLLLDISQPACTAPPSNNTSFATNCFIKDGALGTLTEAGAWFAAMTNDSYSVYGLLARAPAAQVTTTDRAFWLQRIDVAQRSVLSQHPLRLDNTVQIQTFVFDPAAGRIVLGTFEITNAQDPITFKYEITLLNPN